MFDLKTFFILIVLILQAQHTLAGSSQDRRTSVDVSYNGGVVVSVLDELNGEFDFIKYRSLNKYTGVTGDWIRLDAGNLVNDSFVINQINGQGFIEVWFIKEYFGIDSVVWKQNVYIPYTLPVGVDELAKQYMPVVVFHADEEYFPLSLETMLAYTNNSEDVIEVSSTSGSVDLKPGDELKLYMEYNGGSDSYFNFQRNETICELYNECSSVDALYLRFLRGRLDDATVYYDASIEGGSLYLSYYFFYSFDPKIGSFLLPNEYAHAFDRESFVIRFDIDGNNFIPKEIAYAGHLEDQDLKYKGFFENSQDVLVEWSGGKTVVQWEHALKVGKHPVIYKAKGAHAIYPVMGYFGVDTKVAGVWNDEALIEPVGSVDTTKYLLPDGYIQNLEQLDYAALDYMAFSGAWVDVFGGIFSDNAPFPPFIRTPYSSWFSSNSEPSNPATEIDDFDDCLYLDPTVSNGDCQVLNNNFQSILGIGNTHAVTVEVRDAATEQVVPSANIRLASSDGSLNEVRTTNADGTYSIFYKPDSNLTYTLYASSGNTNEVECVRFIVLDSGTAMLNNVESRVCYINETGLTGTIQGSIVDAVDDIPVVGAEIVVKQFGEPLRTIYSDFLGTYQTELPVGEYTLDITSAGYIPATINVNVSENETVIITKLQQVPDAYSGVGTVEGLITDTISGQSLGSVMLEIREGVDVKEGTVVKSAQSNSDGSYRVELNAGNYTVEASLNGYQTAYFNVVSIGGIVTGNQNGALSPLLANDEIRIVLTWGDVPTDLDSHLWTPLIEGNSYHIYYSSMGDSNVAPYVQLDLDDVTSYGPETITIFKLYPGTYYYSVYNFSGFPDIKESDAKVEIYNSSGLVGSYNIPLSGDGRFWNVFSINGETGAITTINQISTNEPAALSLVNDSYQRSGYSSIK